MSRLSEYGPISGVVFGDPYQDLLDEILKGGGGGTKPGSGGTAKPGTTFAQQSAQDKSALQQSRGAGQTLPKGFYQVDSTRATNGITVATLDPTTGNWINAGFPPNAQDKAAVAQQMIAQGQVNRTGAQTSGITPEARPYAGLAGAPGTLQSSAGPVLPGWDAYRQADIGIPAAGTRTYSIGNGPSSGLNVINTGHQGSLPSIPVIPGISSGANGNSIPFGKGNPNQFGGRGEPQTLFPDANVTVPGSYVYGQGNTGAANAAYSVPFNIGPGGAALANIGGNNVQVNSADKGTGYGFVLNAMPSSNVFDTLGRNMPSDPASQAVQIMQLNTALNQLGGGSGAIQALTALNANQFGGYHAGTGNDIFSGNGGSGQGMYWGGYNPDAGGFPAAVGGTPNYAAVGQGIAGAGNAIAGAIRGAAGGAPPVGAVNGSALNTIPGYGFANNQSARDALAAIYSAYGGGGGGGTQNADGAWIFGGGGDGGADSAVPFATGGYVTMGVPRRPLVGAPDGPKSMVTPEPIIGVGAVSGQPRFVVGEDGTGDGRPDQERLSFPPGRMVITPLHRPTPGFADGGTIRPGDDPGIYDPINSMKQGVSGPGGSYNDNPTLDPTPTPTPTPPPEKPPSTPGDTGGGTRPPQGPDGPYQPPQGPIIPPQLPSLIPDYNALDPNVLAPWQQALNQTAAQQHMRDSLQYRRRAGNLGAEMAVTALPGADATKPLGPGMFYDFQPQISQNISDIQSRQRELAGLGAFEDMNPVQQRATFVGNALQDLNRIRQLQDERVAAVAKGNAPSTQAGDTTSWNNELAGIQTQMDLLNGAHPDIYDAKNANPAERESMIRGLTSRADELHSLLRAAQNQGVNALDQQSVIDAQIAAIKDRIGNVNESSLNTELADLRTRMARNQQRVDKTNEVKNLATMGVPNLSTRAA